jgi:hypothetical protein
VGWLGIAEQSPGRAQFTRCVQEAIGVMLCGLATTTWPRAAALRALINKQHNQAPRVSLLCFRSSGTCRELRTHGDVRCDLGPQKNSRFRWKHDCIEQNHRQRVGGGGGLERHAACGMPGRCALRAPGGRAVRGPARQEDGQWPDQLRALSSYSQPRGNGSPATSEALASGGGGCGWPSGGGGAYAPWACCSPWVGGQRLELSTSI